MRRATLLVAIIVVLAGCSDDSAPKAGGGVTTTLGSHDTTTVPATTSMVPTVSTTTTDGYTLDDQGNRIIGVMSGPIGFTCSNAVFPGGEPPQPVASAIDVASLIANAGPPGVDQDDFFDLYAWSIYFEAADWVSLLGVPRFRDEHPDWYVGAYGHADFVGGHGDWAQLGSGWCDVKPHPGTLPVGVRSLVELWDEDYRQFTVKRTVDGPSDGDLAVIEEMMRSEWVHLVYPPLPSDWRLAGSPDPGSHRVSIEVQEGNCASGQPPVDRDIEVLSVPYGDGLALVVIIDPVEGGALCPGNPWYPIAVDLGEPLGTRALYEATTWPPTVMWPQP
ncbi:MAG: hypothetical protein WD652_02350 [Acidimicrobiia bacterium]